MKEKGNWRKENVKKPTVDKGFDNLIGVHTKALEENSKSLIELLQIISKKKLSHSQKSQLKNIKKELNSIDKRLDNLGSYSVAEEEDEDLWD